MGTISFTPAPLSPKFRRELARLAGAGQGAAFVESIDQARAGYAARRAQAATDGEALRDIHRTTAAKLTALAQAAKECAAKMERAVLGLSAQARIELQRTLISPQASPGERARQTTDLQKRLSQLVPDLMFTANLARSAATAAASKQASHRPRGTNPQIAGAILMRDLARISATFLGERLTSTSAFGMRFLECACEGLDGIEKGAALEQRFKRATRNAKKASPRAAGRRKPVPALSSLS